MHPNGKWLSVLLRVLAGALLSFGFLHAYAQSLSATAVSGSQINLSWGMFGEGTVHVKRYIGGEWQTIAEVSVWSPSYSNTGLPTGSTFSYKIVGYCIGEGCVMQETNVASATTWTAPAAPSSLGATTASGTQINLTWNDGSGNETGFKIERKTGSGGTYGQIATVGTNVTSYNSTGLSNGTTYYYRVRATNSVGDSGYTNESNATTYSPPTAPTGLGATAVVGPQANLAWTDASGNETGFKIERKTGTGGTYSEIGTVGSNVTSYGDSTVTGGGGGNTYYYRVRATNATGDSGYSNEATVAFVPPAAPSGLSATDLPSGQIRLAWTDNADSETGFKLERKTGAGGTYAQVAAPASNATVHDDSSGLTAGTTYYYRVLATNIAGDSSYSNEVSISATMPNVTTGTVTYTYDAFGNLTETNAGGVVTTLSYDLRGRKSAMSDPDMGNWTYAYNALGELVRQTDAKSNVTTMQYDVLGRMVSRTEADLISTWTYDTCTKGVGKLCQAASDNGYQRVHAYDSLGRPSTLTTTIDVAYTVTTSYDSAGRLDTLTYPTGFAVQNVYNTSGHLAQVRNAATPSMVYWTASTVSASGRILSEALGNGLTGTRTYDPMDRLLTAVATGALGTPQSNTYAYDILGNLTQRVDVTQSVTETFAYDSLNRLISSSGPALTTKAYDYDAIGNVVYKSDVGVYTYGTKPHAVASVAGTVNASYTYDANGNLTAGNGRTLTYTSFNTPATVTGSGYTYTYTYSAEHERVRLVNSALGTFIYLHPGGAGSLLYEKEIRPGGLVEHKHYISGAGLVGVYVSRSDATTEMRYYHRDHLGSVQVVTSDSGVVLERLAYEPFGKRRYPDGTDDPNNTLFGATTDRGFTGHEHLDEIALIHMNGRIYDPVLARFMTADPFIQAPSFLQSYNRYSYAFNSPLGVTDPTGHFGIGALIVGSIVVGIVARATGHEELSNVAFGVAAGAAVGLYAPFAAGPGVAGTAGISTTGAALGNAALGGAAFGAAASRGDPTAVFQGGVTGAMFGWAGMQGGEWSPERFAAHAAAGCASGEMGGGGGCGKGAASAVAGHGASNYFRNNPIAAIAAGGTVSVIGGGRFVNGAYTAAFGYLFNHLAGQIGSRLSAAASRLLPAERAAALEAEGLLGVHEARGGHTLANHVGRTEAQLAERLAAEPGIDAVSTFTSRAVANYAAESVLTTNAARISQWMNSPTMRPLVLEQTFSESIGAVMTRGAAGVVEGNTARFVLMKNPYTFPHSWFIRTGYVAR